MPPPKKCRMKGCLSTGKTGQRFHRFPTDKERCKEWVRLCGNDLILKWPVAQMPAKFYICSLHFSRKQYCNKYMVLLKGYDGGAIPDQLLGNPLSEELLDRWWRGELINSTVPVQNNFGSNAAKISNPKKVVVLFDPLAQKKQSSSPGRSEFGDEGFVPMEYIDHNNSDDKEDEPFFTQTSSLDSIEPNTRTSNSSPERLCSNLEHSNDGLGPMESMEDNRCNDDDDDDKNQPENQTLLTKPSCLDSLEPNTSGPESCSVKESIFNKNIRDLTLNDFKTKGRAEMSLWLVKSKFSQMQHQVTNLQQNLRRARKKVRELKTMLNNQYQSSEEGETSDD